MQKLEVFRARVLMSGFLLTMTCQGQGTWGHPQKDANILWGIIPIVIVFLLIFWSPLVSLFDEVSSWLGDIIAGPRRRREVEELQRRFYSDELRKNESLRNELHELEERLRRKRGY